MCSAIQPLQQSQHLWTTLQKAPQSLALAIAAKDVVPPGALRPYLWICGLNLATEAIKRDFPVEALACWASALFEPLRLLNNNSYASCFAKQPAG